jgi:colanic acid/amylovoran biosynthesis glycosyltransferase
LNFPFLQQSHPLRVLHSFPNWLPQTQTWLYHQVRYLPEEIESHIVCETTENLDQFSVPHIHALENASRWRYVWDKGLRKLKLRRYLGYGVAIARQQTASILHSHFGDIGWTDLEIARRARLKHVVTFYGYDVNALPTLDSRWYERYHTLFQQVDQILCEGPHMAQCVVKLGCLAEKVRVHHLGIAIDQIPFQLRTWQPGEPLRVLIAASFSEKKGIPDALEALGQFHHEQPLEITIIGDARNHPESLTEKQKILATINKHQIQDCVSMLGYQPHTVMLETAYTHHIFLSPSLTASMGDTEGGAPVSLIEMAATGMPIVSTTHCDIPEVIQHGKTGLLAPERDITSLVNHLRWLTQHPDRWQEMAIAGRTHVEKEFSATIQGKKLAEIYRGLAGTGKST